MSRCFGSCASVWVILYTKMHVFLILEHMAEDSILTKILELRQSTIPGIFETCRYSSIFLARPETTTADNFGRSGVFPHLLV